MRLSSLFSCVLLLAGSIACQPAESDPQAILKASGITEVSRGDITGFVTLCDEFGVTKAKSDSMIVSLEGLQTAFPVRTRPEGRFVIANAYAGRYNLSYNKPDYGNYKLIGVQHGGSITTMAQSVTIWERPKTAPSDLAVTIDGLKLTLTGVSVPVQPAGTAQEQQRRIRIFFGRDEKVSALNYITTLEQTIVPPGGTGAFAAKLLADDLLAFKPGERVYAIAYGITAFENAYEDPDKKQKIYSGINPVPSNVVSFVLP
jgi:hypothetical protein